MLLLDGHSSHYQPDLVRMAARVGVILFALPPNTTHFIQPLDKTVFGQMKVYWWQECQNFMARNPGKVITHSDFNDIFSRAWYHGGTHENIVSAFRATGIYPLNRNAVHIPGEDKRKSIPPANAYIAFHPSYSPAPRQKYVCSVPEKQPLHTCSSSESSLRYSLSPTDNDFEPRSLECSLSADESPEVGASNLSEHSCVLQMMRNCLYISHLMK